MEEKSALTSANVNNFRSGHHHVDVDHVGKNVVVVKKGGRRSSLDVVVEVDGHRLQLRRPRRNDGHLFPRRLLRPAKRLPTPTSLNVHDTTSRRRHDDDCLPSIRLLHSGLRRPSTSTTSCQLRHKTKP